MKPEKFLYFSDLHIPNHHGKTIDDIAALISEHKPDHIINGGDHFDGNAASRWPNEATHTLEKEYTIGCDILKRFRCAAPKHCQLIWTLGNHDQNLLDQNRIPKDLRSLCDWNANPTKFPEFQRWKQRRYEARKTVCTYRVGQVVFMHGFTASNSGLTAQMYEYCPIWGALVTGHTHRPSDLIQAIHCGSRLPYWRMNNGCAQDYKNTEKVHYMRRTTTANWGHSAIVGWAMPIKSPREARYWDMENVIFRQGSDFEKHWEPKKNA